MKTIGQILKQARLEKGLSIATVAKRTKGRQDYLEAIEKNKFDQLPSSAFVKGFIQNYAKTVSLDPNTAAAVFRRDFDQNQQGKIIPRGVAKPLANPSRIWNPRTTTAILAIALVLIVGFYALSQLLNLQSAPPVNLTSPTTDVLTNSIVLVKGTTSNDAIVTVNDQPVSLDLQGNFQTNLDLPPGQHTLVIKATADNNKTTTFTRTITIQPEE